MTEASYATYWKAWVALLALTVLMVASPGGHAVTAAAIAIKAGIIGAWFMHLRYERAALSLAILLITLGTAAVLFLLLSFDAVPA